MDLKLKWHNQTYSMELAAAVQPITCTVLKVRHDPST